MVYREREGWEGGGGGRSGWGMGWAREGVASCGSVVTADGGWGRGGEREKKKNRLDRFAFTPDVLLESGGRAGRERQHLAAAAGSHLVLLTA